MTNETEMREELLPCPFCGGEATYTKGFGRNYAQCGNQPCWMYGIMARPEEWQARARLGNGEAKPVEAGEVAEVIAEATEGEGADSSIYLFQAQAILSRYNVSSKE